MAQTENGDDNSDETRWAVLMGSAQGGNEADYRQLLVELSAAIKYYLLNRIGPQHFVDDCVQESLIAVHQARHSYDTRHLFRRWLFAIVRHKAIDSLRRQRSQRHLAREQEHIIEGVHNSTRELDNDITQGRLMKCLSAQHREALTLTKFVGLSNAEAAKQLHISEGAVKVRVHRAIGNLTRLMEADA